MSLTYGKYGMDDHCDHCDTFWVKDERGVVIAETISGYSAKTIADAPEFLGKLKTALAGNDAVVAACDAVEKAIRAGRV